MGRQRGIGCLGVAFCRTVDAMGWELVSKAYADCRSDADALEKRIVGLQQIKIYPKINLPSLPPKQVVGVQVYKDHVKFRFKI